MKGLDSNSAAIRLSNEEIEASSRCICFNLAGLRLYSQTEAGATSSLESDDDIDSLFLRVRLYFQLEPGAGTSALREASHVFSQGCLPETVNIRLVKDRVITERPLRFQSFDLFIRQSVDDQIAHEVARSFDDVESIGDAFRGIVKLG